MPIRKQDILDFERRRGQKNVSLRRAYNKALRAGQIDQHILVATEPEVKAEQTRRIVITDEKLHFHGLTSIINTTLSGNCDEVQEQLRSVKQVYLQQVCTELMKDAGQIFDDHFDAVMCRN